MRDRLTNNSREAAQVLREIEAMEKTFTACDDAS